MCVCSDLLDSVVVGVVKVICGSGLSETGAGLHGLLLLIQQRLQVFDHDGVEDAVTLQVHFDGLQAVGGNSDVHRRVHSSHVSPEVHLRGKTGHSEFLTIQCFNSRIRRFELWLVDDLVLLHVLQGLDEKQLGFILWKDTKHLLPEKNNAIHIC